MTEPQQAEEFDFEAFMQNIKEGSKRLKERKITVADVEGLIRALSFYADPATYFAISVLPDPPCGDFVRDYSRCGADWGQRPGKRARRALTKFEATLRKKYAGVERKN
jgi:hypothetical protein